MSDAQIVGQLELWSGYLTKDNPINDFFRTIGWAFIKFLRLLCNIMQDSITLIYDRIDFSDSPFIKDYLARLHPLIMILFALGVMALGYYVMFKRRDMNAGAVQVVVLLLIVFTALPTFSALTANLTRAASGAAEEAWGGRGFTAADGIIADNVIDIRLVESGGMFAAGPLGNKGKNRIMEWANGGKDGVRLVDVTKAMDSGMGSTILESLKYEVSYEESADGKPVLLNGPGIDFWDKAYYQYYVGFGLIIASTIPLFLVLLFTCFKAALIIYDLGRHIVLTPFVAIADMGSGQKTKEILRSFATMFMLLFFIIILLGVYLVFIAYINDWYRHAPATGVNTFVYIIFQIAAAVATIDGPDFMMKIFGVDAGVKSGFQALMGAYAVGRVLGGAARGGVRGAQNIKSWTRGDLNGYGARVRTNPITRNQWQAGGARIAQPSGGGSAGGSAGSGGGASSGGGSSGGGSGGAGGGGSAAGRYSRSGGGGGRDGKDGKDGKDGRDGRDGAGMGGAKGSGRADGNEGGAQGGGGPGGANRGGGRVDMGEARRARKRSEDGRRPPSPYAGASEPRPRPPGPKGPGPGAPPRPETPKSPDRPRGGKGGTEG